MKENICSFVFNFICMLQGYSVYLVLMYFSAFLVVLPIVIGLLKKVFLSKTLIPFFILTICYLVLEIISAISIHFHLSNMFSFRICTFLEASLISIYFYRVLFKSISKYLVIIGYPFLLFFAYIDFKSKSPLEVDNLSLSLTSLFLVIYSLFTYYDSIQNIVDQDILSSPFFWLNTAVLFYFGGNLFLFIFSNYLTNGAQLNGLWIINLVLNVFYYSLITIGFWKHRIK